MLHSARAAQLCPVNYPQLPSTFVCPLFVLLSLTDGGYIIIGGQHFSKACKEYRTAKGSPFVDQPMENLPDWVRYVSAPILRIGTPVQVCTSAAGRHQRSQENSNPSTTSTWAQCFCITLNKLNENFEGGVDIDILIKIRFDSGIPMHRLLPDGGRTKKAKKCKKSGTAETLAVPTAEKA